MWYVVWSYSIHVCAEPCRRLISRLILTEKINVVDHSLSCPSLGRNLTNEYNSRDLAIRRFVPELSRQINWNGHVGSVVAEVVDYLVYITDFRFTGKVRMTISTASHSDTFSLTKTIQLFWVMWPLILWHQNPSEFNIFCQWSMFVFQ